MSSPDLRITARARQDMTRMLRRSEILWGRDQRVRTLNWHNDAYQTIREHPEIGVERSTLGNGIRVLANHHHLILYRRRGNALFILRVVHERMDVDSLSTSGS